MLFILPAVVIRQLAYLRHRRALLACLKPQLIGGAPLSAEGNADAPRALDLKSSGSILRIPHFDATFDRMMRAGPSAQEEMLDLMLRGKKKECAYGFCDIRQFTDTVECLQDQVMLFTNSVGEIIHQACHDNKGEPNKNIGDAFLIVWRPTPLKPSNRPLASRAAVGC